MNIHNSADVRNLHSFYRIVIENGGVICYTEPDYDWKLERMS